jgi:hypothetical protein
MVGIDASDKITKMTNDNAHGAYNIYNYAIFTPNGNFLLEPFYCPFLIVYLAYFVNGGCHWKAHITRRERTYLYVCITQYQTRPG